MKPKVCKNCGYVGRPIHDEFSSYFIDAFVWLVAFAIGMITTIFPLVLLGPIFTMVHMWKFMSRCPKCDELDMVSQKHANHRHVN